MYSITASTQWDLLFLRYSLPSYSYWCLFAVCVCYRINAPLASYCNTVFISSGSVSFDDWVIFINIVGGVLPSALDAGAVAVCVTGKFCAAAVGGCFFPLQASGFINSVYRLLTRFSLSEQQMSGCRLHHILLFSCISFGIRNRRHPRLYHSKAGVPVHLL